MLLLNAALFFKSALYASALIVQAFSSAAGCYGGQIPRRRSGGMSRDCCYDYALAVVIAMVVIVALVVVTRAPTVITPGPVTAAIAVITMLFLIARNVLAVVPVVLHKVDPLAAGVVFSAVPGPMPAMARGYAQIDRRAIHLYPLDYSGLTIDHSRLRKIADVESAIEAGFADVNRNSDVSCECRGGDGGGGYRRCDQKTFHDESPVAGGS